MKIRFLSHGTAIACLVLAGNGVWAGQQAVDCASKAGIIERAKCLAENAASQSKADAPGSTLPQAAATSPATPATSASEAASHKGSITVGDSCKNSPDLIDNGRRHPVERPITTTSNDPQLPAYLFPSVAVSGGYCTSDGKKYPTMNERLGIYQSDRHMCSTLLNISTCQYYRVLYKIKSEPLSRPVVMEGKVMDTRYVSHYQNGVESIIKIDASERAASATSARPSTTSHAASTANPSDHTVRTYKCSMQTKDGIKKRTYHEYSLELAQDKAFNYYKEILVGGKDQIACKLD